MKEQLEGFIRSKVKAPDDKEISAILEIFQVRELLKGEFFKDQNQICDRLGFLINGSTRHFVIKRNGEEVTVRVVQENNFVADIFSVRTGEKTPINIEVLEPTTMLVAPVDDMKKLLEVNLTLNRLIREYMADNMVEMGKLHFTFLTGTAKERYRFILENNPRLVKSVPLRYIASMIGITPTQLSRIRKRKEK